MTETVDDFFKGSAMERIKSYERRSEFYIHKYKFLKDFTLIAKVFREDGRGHLVITHTPSKESDTLSCIHVCVTTITKEEYNEYAGDDAFLINARSTENREEIILSAEERFIAFRSWVAGIAKCGEDAFRIQYEIENLAHHAYPIVSFLMKFIAKYDLNFFKDYLWKIERECTYGGKLHESSLIANLIPFVNMIVNLEDFNLKTKYFKLIEALSPPFDIFLLNSNVFRSYRACVENATEKFDEMINNLGQFKNAKLKRSAKNLVKILAYDCEDLPNASNRFLEKLLNLKNFPIDLFDDLDEDEMCDLCKLDAFTSWKYAEMLSETRNIELVRMLLKDERCKDLKHLRRLFKSKDVDVLKMLASNEFLVDVEEYGSLFDCEEEDVLLEIAKNPIAKKRQEFLRFFDVLKENSFKSLVGIEYAPENFVLIMQIVSDPENCAFDEYKNLFNYKSKFVLRCIAQNPNAVRFQDEFRKLFKIVPVSVAKNPNASQFEEYGSLFDLDPVAAERVERKKLKDLAKKRNEKNKKAELNDQDDLKIEELLTDDEIDKMGRLSKVIHEKSDTFKNTLILSQGSGDYVGYSKLIDEYGSLLESNLNAMRFGKYDDFVNYHISSGDAHPDDNPYYIYFKSINQYFKSHYPRCYAGKNAMIAFYLRNQFKKLFDDENDYVQYHIIQNPFILLYPKQITDMMLTHGHDNSWNLWNNFAAHLQAPFMTDLYKKTFEIKKCWSHIASNKNAVYFNEFSQLFTEKSRYIKSTLAKNVNAPIYASEFRKLFNGIDENIKEYNESKEYFDISNVAKNLASNPNAVKFPEFKKLFEYKKITRYRQTEYKLGNELLYNMNVPLYYPKEYCKLIEVTFKNVDNDNMKAIGWNPNAVRFKRRINNRIKAFLYRKGNEGWTDDEQIFLRGISSSPYLTDLPMFQELFECIGLPDMLIGLAWNPYATRFPQFRKLFDVLEHPYVFDTNSLSQYSSVLGAISENVMAPLYYPNEFRRLFHS
ncbi:MAG: hypothetical protein ACXAC7_21845, partial [Candidatus Hodarchaeales archaeon]